MAIHPSEEASQQAPSIDVHAWTVEQATIALNSVTISAPGDSGGATVSLQIPLDDQSEPPAAPDITIAKEAKVGTTYKRKEPLRRDSLKRRESLLKGKEGSRRRQRWENGMLAPCDPSQALVTFYDTNYRNSATVYAIKLKYESSDRLLNNPWAVPPSAEDWEIRPNYRSHRFPYYLAPLWDAGLSRQSEKRRAATIAAKTTTRATANKPTEPGVVPKELKDKIKRSRGAKGLLMDLENEVRRFVEQWEEREKAAEAEGFPKQTELDSDDDEIVFVGRNGQMSDLRSPRHSDEVDRELMVFETPASDQGGVFARWLVHHLGTYYGLKTWSITVGDPARREAYIGLKDATMKSGRRRDSVCAPMPRPLWGLV